MNELATALSVIRDYIDEFFFEPRKNWPDHEFNRRSYERWAAKELMLYLEGHWGEKKPADLIIAFIGTMDAYSDICDEKLKTFRFGLARDTAEEILYLFL